MRGPRSIQETVEEDRTPRRVGPGPASPGMRDLELIQRVKAGRPGAFDELYYAFVDRVHRKLYAVVGPDPEIDDLIQQTFVQVHRRIHTFRGECAFGTWLHRVTLNVALMHLRTRRRRGRFGRTQAVPEDLPEPPGRAGPDEVAGQRERLRLVHRILEGIGPKKRIVFVLYHFEGHTLEEIAELTGASVHTVASRLRAARKEVQRALARHALRERRAIA